MIKDLKFKKISEGKLKYSRKVNSDNMSVLEWIEYHQGKHFCHCGCGEEIEIKAHHHNPYCGIPKYISGHNMKMSEARERARDKVIKQLESGNINPITRGMLGKHHTEVTRKQQSESRKNWIDKNYEYFCDILIKSGSKRKGIKNPDHSKFMVEYYMTHGAPMKGRHHTLESRIKNSCSHRGITIEEFNGFTEHQQREFYGELFYNEWRTSVFERDNYTCQMCGKRGGYLEGHHILPVRDYPEFVIIVDNGVTLCRDCHRPIYPNEMDLMPEFLGKIFDDKAEMIWN